MNFNDLQSISEAYDQVHQLDELTATGGGVGFELGRGRKAITANVQTDKGSVSTAFGTQKVGGQTSASDAVDDALNRLKNPTAAAKPAPQERTVPYGRVNASFTGGSVPKPRSNPNNTAKPQPPTGTKPTPPKDKRTDAPKPPVVPNDSGRPTERVQNPSIEFSRKPEPKPESPKNFGSRYRGLNMDTMSDLDTYNLVLEYLLDEGFASTEQSADKIILNMSESWFESILEEVSLGK